MSRQRNVIDFAGWKQSHSTSHTAIVRLAPELDGLETLYTNDANPGLYFNLKIVCWALKEDGEVVGLVPWLDDIIECPDFDDPLNGYWAGYFNPNTSEIFYTPPMHKISELESAYEYYGPAESETDIVQEIPEVLGTHAVMTDDSFQTIKLIEVISWQLCGNGKILGMLANYDQVENFPILAGEQCLYPAQTYPDFKYFFHFSLVNKIKKNDPDALDALSLLSTLPTQS